MTSIKKLQIRLISHNKKTMKKLSLHELNRPDIQEFKNLSKIPVIVILDNIRSAMNVGSFFRTCDAFCVEKLILTGITATPPNREITKTAIGATESVDWEYADSIQDVCLHLKSLGYICLAVEQTDSSVNFAGYDINTSIKYAIIFGNEVEGVSDEALSHCSLALEIPQSGTKHSLNVSVCGGVILWDFYKKFTQS